MSATEQLLERIALALETRAGRERLGFTSASDTQYVWVGREGDACWYSRENEQNVAIKHSAIVGRLIGLKCKIKEYKGAEVSKLVTLLDCGDMRVHLECGMETSFARSLLLKLTVLPASLLGEPIKIAVRPGDDEEGKTVFASIYTGRTALSADWNKDIACAELLDQCCKSLGFDSSADDVSRGSLDRQISAEFHRLKKAGLSVEQIRAMAAKKFPGFTASKDLSSQQSYRLLEMLVHVDTPL